MSVKGHEGQFRPPSLSGRCRLDESTFAGMGGKEEDAPKAAFAALWRRCFRRIGHLKK
jgi:hypothetical protein